MDTLEIEPYKITGLSGINFILGKNGAGKSTLLRACAKDQSNRKYIVPERAGTLRWAAHVEQNITNNPDWLRQTRTQNQTTDFRAQVISAYRRLELAALRRFEKTKNEKDGFEPVLSKINNLLDQVILQRSGSDFIVKGRRTGVQVQPETISSGESELISLAIECLEFPFTHPDSANLLLLLDEPDVHLHPDLQSRLAEFIVTLHREHKITIVIASHSTALLGAFVATDVDLHIAFMIAGETNVHFEPIDGFLRLVLPVFGAHPLSNIFNQAPPLIVEGEDDERIWQSAVRTSRGKIKVYPCPIQGIGNMSEYEDSMIKILNSVYDNGHAYSLRDGDDDVSGNMPDKVPLVRFKLACRDPENLLLSDEVLSSLATHWHDLKDGIDAWLKSNAKHPHYLAMQTFATSGYDRRSGDVKEMRNDIMGIIGKSIPWEVAVGRVIGQMFGCAPSNAPTSIWSFLGSKLCNALLR